MTKSHDIQNDIFKGHFKNQMTVEPICKHGTGLLITPFPDLKETVGGGGGGVTYIRDTDNTHTALVIRQWSSLTSAKMYAICTC